MLVRIQVQLGKNWSWYHITTSQRGFNGVVESFFKYEFPMVYTTPQKKKKKEKVDISRGLYVCKVHTELI